MENKLEQLLNTLIQRGWKPFGKDKKFDIWIECLPYKKIRVCLKKPDYDYYVYSYRDIVSAESWLWQFVCENGMIKWMLVDIDGSAYKYYITESSLKDESELEDFLLNSISLHE